MEAETNMNEDLKIEKFLDEIEELIQKCDNEFGTIDGSFKLKKKLESEKKFLNSIKDSEIEVKEASLCCLNLIHLKALIKQIDALENITAILKPFKDKQNNITTVDIVYDFGYKWAKIIARNPQRLHFKVFCEYDTEVFKQVQQFMTAAQFNTFNYKIPKVSFFFSNGITQALCEKIEPHLSVVGDIVEVDRILEEKLRLQEENESSSDEDFFQSPIKVCLDNEISADTSTLNLSDFEDLILESKPYGNLNKVNLDVSTLLAMVSDLSNGYHGYEFDKEYLNQQAEQEEKCQVVPTIEEFLKGKELFVCQTAYDSFLNIINTVGGRRERERSKLLEKRVNNG